MIDTNQLGAYISQQWEVSSEAAGNAARGTLLLLATEARDAYPDAVGIRIGSSDQGDFMEVQAVLDAEFNNLDEDGDFDEDALAWGLDDHNKDAWEPLCTETEQSRRRNPQYVIYIDKVIAEVPGKVGLA